MNERRKDGRMEGREGGKGGREGEDVVVVYFPNCDRHTADKYIFSGPQFVVIPSEHYSCDL